MSETGHASPSRAMASADAEEIEVIPLRHRGRQLCAVAAAVLIAMLFNTLVTNDRFQWDVVREYFTHDRILEGLWHTILLTVVAMLIGIVGGTLLAVMRLSDNPLLRSTAYGYIWFFRGTPLLVQLIFWYNLSALYPKLSLGVPFGPEFISGNVNSIVTVYVAAFLGLGLNEAAYMSEIVRAGINSVDSGQTQAAQALGMRGSTVFFRIILPQAMRVIIPPTGNQVIGMLKTTSLVSVIALPDLLYSAQLIYSRNFQPIPLLIAVSIWYLILTTVLSIGQYYIERHYSRGTGSTRARRERGGLRRAINRMPGLGEGASP